MSLTNYRGLIQPQTFGGGIVIDLGMGFYAEVFYPPPLSLDHQGVTHSIESLNVKKKVVSI